MRRLIRWGFNGAAAISAAMLLATLVLWVSSYFVVDELTWERPNVVSPQEGPYAWTTRAESGRFWASRGVEFPFMKPEMGFHLFRTSGGIGSGRDGLGFAIHFDRSGMKYVINVSPNGVFTDGGLQYCAGDGSIDQLKFPCWLPALLFAAIPAWWLIRKVRRSRRVRLGFCRSCGYDLRATPRRCPECGTEPRDAVGS